MQIGERLSGLSLKDAEATTEKDTWGVHWIQGVKGLGVKVQGF